MSNRVTVHMVANAHLDPVWLWDWRTGMAEAVATCKSAADRLDEYPEFVFTRGEAWVYRQVQHLDPALFERIQAFVTAGRWQIVNGWVVQPDCNLPTPEAFLRQMELGQRYFREQFGRTATVGYNVDSFGHTAILPYLLQSNGYDSYVFLRPMQHERPLPSNLFRWRSPGGGEVTAYRIPITYSTRVDDLQEHIEKTLEQRPQETNHVMCFYGVGNHGGGPTRKQIEYILEHRHSFDRAELVFSHPRAFFDAVRDASERLPVVEGELQMHAIGCYSAINRFKRCVVSAENLAIQAEQVCSLLPDHTPADSQGCLNRAWDAICFNQFHDTLCGTSIPSAYEDGRDQAGSARAAADELIVRTTRRWAANLPGDGQGDAILVLNPSSVGRGTWIEYEPWLEWQEWGGRKLIDEEDREIYYQRVAPSSHVPGMYRILFPLIVPPQRHRILRLLEQPPGEVPQRLRVDGSTLENDHLRLELGPTGIANVVLPVLGAGCFASRGISLTIREDLTDTWSHDVDRFDGREMGAFSWESPVVAEAGPLRTTLHCAAAFGASTAAADVSLYHSEPWIELRLRINWQHPRCVLKLNVPVAGRVTGRRDAVPGLWLNRPLDGREYPYHGATLLSTTAAGQGLAVGIVAPHTYSLDVDEGGLHLTLLRSPAYAHHAPCPLDLRLHPRYTDLGEHDFTIRIWSALHLACDDLDALLLDALQPVLVWDHHAP